MSGAPAGAARPIWPQACTEHRAGRGAAPGRAKKARRASSHCTSKFVTSDRTTTSSSVSGPSSAAKRNIANLHAAKTKCANKGTNKVRAANSTARQSKAHPARSTWTIAWPSHARSLPTQRERATTPYKHHASVSVEYFSSVQMSALDRSHLCAGVEQSSAAARLASAQAVRHCSGSLSRSVVLMVAEQKGQGRCSCSSARVHDAQVMLCPHG